MVNSWVIKEPINSSKDIIFRYFASWMAITFGSHLSDRDLKIFYTKSALEYILPRLFKPLVILVNLINIADIVSLGSILNSS